MSDSHSQEISDIFLSTYARQRKQVADQLRCYFAESTVFISKLFGSVPKQTVDAALQCMVPFVMPSKGANEQEVYDSFIEFLNHLVEVCQPSSTTNCLRFSKYDGEMDDVGKGKPLRPPIVGGEDSTISRIKDGVKISWNEVQVVCEVKADQVDLLEQAAVYARCMLASRPHLAFAPALVLETKHQAVRFELFHRSGGTTTPAYKITEYRCLHPLVQTLCMFLRSEHRSGEDPLMDSHFLRYRDDTVLVLHQTIYQSCDIRGPATFIALASPYTVDPQSAPVDPIPVGMSVDSVGAPEPPPRVDPLVGTTVSASHEEQPPSVTSFATLSQPEATKIDGSEARVLLATPSIPNIPQANVLHEILPPSLIVKISTARNGYEDGEIFRAVQGKMGIPTIYAYWKSSSGHKHHHTENFFPPDAQTIHGTDAFGDFQLPTPRSRTYVLM